ncbi:MAG TPA: DUF2637 domain-containing protein [Mycobacteriales bacterium]|nr:DUF2637 domain-containing protein [Mycobacteriales bacterium]
MTATGPPTTPRRGLVWAAGLVVALGAGIATAHGLYQVALAAGVPTPVGWLYPLITDGLALVAYAATNRLTDRGRGYAWTIVVLAAGLSGLAQATYLAGAVAAAPTPLRFGVGAWPAIAAAIAAHLIHLLNPHPDHTPVTPTSQPTPAPAVQPAAVRTTVPVAGTPAGHDRPAVHPAAGPPDEPANTTPARLYGPAVNSTPVTLNTARPDDRPPSAQATTPDQHAGPVHNQPTQLGQATPGAAPTDRAAYASVQPPSTAEQPGPVVQPPVRPAAGRSVRTASDRALAHARAYQARHGELPTVTRLTELAGVARGTAGQVLKNLRTQRPALHAVPTTANPED